jgi:hypothetical protein
VGFDVPAVVDIKSFIFWDVALYSPLNVNRRFGGTCLHLNLLYAALFAWFIIPAWK